MNGNTQTLEMKVASKSDEAVSSLDKLISKLTSVEKNVSNIESKVSKTSSVKNIATQINQISKNSEKATNSVNKLGKALSFGGAYLGIKNVVGQFLKWMDYSVDFTEQLNLFNVVFKNIEKNGTTMYSKLGQEATQFQYKLNEAFGTNKTETLKYQGLYRSMGENVGIDEEHASLMSQAMTKLTYDLASLYNRSEKDTAEAIRAGVYAGQTKPLRGFGIDVTQQSLQPIVNELGITDDSGEIKTVRQMSQAEKEILRYIAVLRQSSVAHGDFANTIESPANQLKIFRQQLVETKISITSLFMGTFSQILPYANAILMVIKEITKAIANMFGIELKDYNTGIASSEDSFVDFGDSVDDATGKVKELKRQVLGFDQINNINENKDSGSGSSGGGGTLGGIDQRLLDAIKDYDNGMESVRMKATQIRDRIMEWLGFTKKINPITGETYFEYEGIDKTLKNMWNSFKGLSTQGKILVGLGLVAGATKLWNIGKKLVTVLGNSGLGRAVKSLISPMSSLFSWMKVGVQVNGKLNTGLKDGIQAWREQNVLVKNADGSLNKWKTTMNGATIAVKGLITGAVGLFTVNQSMKSLSTEGANLANVLGLVTGSLTTIASGVQIGAIFGPWGAVIGGATGALLSLISAMQGYQTESDKIVSSSEAVIESSNKIMDQYKSIEESYATESAMQLYYENLLKELEGIVDANGQVQKGYEERANFIVTTLNNAYGTEMKIIDGKIQNYSEEVNSIKSIIAEKQKQIAIELSEEKYKVALENKTEAYKNLKNAQKDLTDAQNNYNDALERTKNRLNAMSDAQKQKLINTYGSIDAAAKEQMSYHETAKALDEAKKAYNDASDVYSYNVETIMNYQDILVADANTDAELIKQKLNEITNSHIENGKVIKNNYSDQITDAQWYYDEYIKLAKENNVEITDDVKAFANERYNAVLGELLNETKAIGKDGTVSKDLAKAWYTLGQTNKDKFLEKFQELPPEIQQKIINKMYDQGYTISSELQAGIQSFNPTIKVDANTTSAETKIKDFVNRMSGIIGGGLNAVFGGGSGGGGFRANGGIYTNGSWKSVTAYASGGTPPSGELFIAREAGPEFVGTIGGHTAVMNNMQIVESVKAGVYEAVASAMSQFGGMGSDIDVYVHTDEGTVVDRINQRTKQTGVCPINI